MPNYRIAVADCAGPCGDTHAEFTDLPEALTTAHELRQRLPRHVFNVYDHDDPEIGWLSWEDVDELAGT